MISDTGGGETDTEVIREDDSRSRVDKQTAETELIKEADSRAAAVLVTGG